MLYDFIASLMNGNPFLTTIIIDNVIFFIVNLKLLYRIFKIKHWAHSSLVERCVDIVEVVSSILTVPTKKAHKTNIIKSNLPIYS